jgi:hypothetical protein
MSHKSKPHGQHKARDTGPWLPHRDWRVYVAVALMLVSMFVYLATMDEALPPGGSAAQPVPAAPGP